MSIRLSDDQLSEAGSEDRRSINEDIKIEPIVDVDNFTDDEEEDEPLEATELPSLLGDAIKECDLKDLKKLLKKANEMELNAPEVVDGAIYLERCSLMKKELIAAVNGNMGQQVIADALNKAKEIPNFKCDVLDATKSALATLRGAGTIELDMERAMERCDLEKLQKLIEKANSIEFDGEVVEASVKFCEKVTKISASLQEAIEHKRGGELEEAIEEAKMISNFDPEALETAETTFTELMATEDANHNELLDALEVTVVHNNIDGMIPLVQKAQLYGIRGNATLTKAQKIVDIHTTLSDALRDRNVELLREGFAKAKVLPSVKLPIFAQAEKQRERLELEAPVMELLRKALQAKRISLLTEAIDAAEELDQKMLKMLEASAAASRGKDLGLGESASTPIVETVTERNEQDTENMTAVEKRRAKALAKHVNRQESKRKDDGGGKIKYIKFNPPELEQARDLRMVITRIEADISNGMKRCAHEKHLPDILKECRSLGLKNKAVLKASSLLFRVSKAKHQMKEALREAKESQGSDSSKILAAATYAKTQVHDRFTDPMIEQCVTEIKRMEEMRRHEVWIQHLTAVTKASPLYHATGRSPMLTRRQSSGESRSRSSVKVAPKRRASVNKDKRPSITSQQYDSRKGAEVMDPSSLAFSLDSLLRDAVDEATETGRPIYEQFMSSEHPLVVEAEKVLKRRTVLREGMDALLKVADRDISDPRIANNFMERARDALTELAELDGLTEDSEEILVAKITEATIKDEAETVKDMIAMYVLATGNKQLPRLPASLPPKEIMPPAFKRQTHEAEHTTQEPDDYVKTTSYSLMHYAALQGAVNTGMMLAAKYGKDLLIQPEENYGMSPLHVAAMRGRFAFLEMAVRTLSGLSTANKSDAAYQSALQRVLTNRDHQGRTPLHLACYSGRPLTANWLIQNGASTEVVDRDGRTPVATAKEMGHSGLAADLQILLKNQKPI